MCLSPHVPRPQAQKLQDDLVLVPEGFFTCHQSGIPEAATRARSFRLDCGRCTTAQF